MAKSTATERWEICVWLPQVLVIAGVEFLQELRAPLVLGVQVLHQTLVAYHVLADDVMALLRVLSNVVQLLHPVEEKHINDLFVYTKGQLK